jgi:hypothetical protein
MPPAFIPFDGWQPSGGYFGEGWNVATNLYPFFGDWRPFPAFNPGASVADGPMTGRHVHMWGANLGGAFGPPFYSPSNPTMYCGSPTKLYAFNSGGFTNLSRAGNYTAGGGGWKFASVGNDVWATNWVDELQRRTNGTGLFANGLVSTFKPRPRHIAVIREHLVWANDSAARQDDWGWSDADDATNMDKATGTSTSLAYKAPSLVSSPGQITGLLGGQYGLLWKEFATYYIEYAGPPIVMRTEMIHDTVGTSFPSSVIRSPHGVFFRGADGFYRIEGLNRPVKISPSGLDRVVLDSGFSAFPFDPVNAHTIWEEDLQMFGFHVPGRPLVGWLMNLSWEVGGNVVILHDPVADTWTRADLPTKSGAIVGRPHAASLYEQLLALLWTGTATQYAPQTSAGAVLAPTATLNYRPAAFEQMGPQNQSLLEGVLPVFSKTSASGSPLTYSVTVTPYLDPHGSPGTPETRAYTDRDTVAGYYPFRVPGRFFQISIGCSAENFAHFSGLWAWSRVLT